MNLLQMYPIFLPTYGGDINLTHKDEKVLIGMFIVMHLIGIIHYIVYRIRKHLLKDDFMSIDSIWYGMASLLGMVWATVIIIWLGMVIASFL